MATMRIIFFSESIKDDLNGKVAWPIQVTPY